MVNKHKAPAIFTAMVGIDMCSTMDMDTTLKVLPADRDTIEKIVNEILAVEVGDNVTLSIKNIKNIHDASEYDDFIIGNEALFFTMRVDFKIDVTTGDVIIAREVDYSFKTLFEDRSIIIKAYNHYTYWLKSSCRYWRGMFQTP